MPSRLDKIMAGLLQDKSPAYTLPDGVPGPEPEHVTAWQSFIKTAGYLAAPPEVFEEEVMSLSAARDFIREHSADYFGTRSPDPRTFPVLVIAAPAGIGKSYLMAREAERLAEETGRRVGLLGPRHDHFVTTVRMAEHPDWWHEWLARSNDDPLTCLYSREIALYMDRGYEGNTFCRSVCGWDYIKGGCAWHAQKNLYLGPDGKRIMYGQHAHLFTGHPVPVGFLIGDESPLGGVVRSWRIPTAKIAPAGLPLDDPLTELLHLMIRFSSQGQKLSGPALIQALGGPEFVLEAIELMAPPPSGRIRVAEQVHDLDYNHLATVAWLLKREATAALAGQHYPYRVWLDGDGLTLDTRHKIEWRGIDSRTSGWPLHTAWTDATANPHIYQAIFGRPVKVVRPMVKDFARIIQVWDRANGVGTLRKEPGVRNQLIEQVRHVADATKEDGDQVGIVTLLDMVQELQDLASLGTDGKPLIGHYYAERGSNDFETVKLLVMGGVPSPPFEELHRLARCLWINRMEPFTDADGKLPIRDELRPFNYRWPDGSGRAWPVRGLWDDPDLAALQEQFIDAELIQTINRARGVLREDDPPYVLMLLNRPIPSIRPMAIVTIQDLLQAPGSVSKWLWARFKDYTDRVYQEGGTVTVSGIVAALGYDRKTAEGYYNRFRLEALQPGTGWEEGLYSAGRGRPARGLTARQAPN